MENLIKKYSRTFICGIGGVFIVTGVGIVSGSVGWTFIIFGAMVLICTGVSALEMNP